jgi:hypothetical protein
VARTIRSNVVTWAAGGAAQDSELVLQDQDLWVLGGVISVREDQQAGGRADCQREYEQHRRMLWSPWSRCESEFLRPTGAFGRSGVVRLDSPGAAQRASPPAELVEQRFGRRVCWLWVAKVAVLAELVMDLVEAHGVPDGDGVQLRKDSTQLFDRAQASGYAAAGDEGDQFGSPLVAKGVDGGLERAGVAVVVLGRDDNDGVRRADPFGEGRRVAAVVQVCRQGQVGEVNDVELNVVARFSPADEPVGDRGPEPTCSDAGDDERELIAVFSYDSSITDSSMVATPVRSVRR